MCVGVCVHICAGAFGGQRSISEVGSPPSFFFFFFLRQHLSLTWGSPISPGEPPEGILLSPLPWTGLVTTSDILGWELNSCTSPPLSPLPQSLLF